MSRLNPFELKQKVQEELKNICRYLRQVKLQNKNLFNDRNRAPSPA